MTGYFFVSMVEILVTWYNLFMKHNTNVHIILPWLWWTGMWGCWCWRSHCHWWRLCHRIHCRWHAGEDLGWLVVWWSPDYSLPASNHHHTHMYHLITQKQNIIKNTRGGESGIRESLTICNVCWMLLGRTKKSLHSILIWDIFTKVTPLLSFRPVPLCESNQSQNLFIIA